MLTENTIQLLFDYHGDCDEQEFEDDLMRLLFIFRLVNRYVSKGETNYRLLINHVIIFYNVFGVLAPIALREYAYYHKNPDIRQYLNSVLKVCGRLDNGDTEYNELFVEALEGSFNAD